MNENLMALLNYRDAKAALISEQINKYGKPIIAIRCNIPGPEKKAPWAEKLYKEALETVESALERENIAYVSVLEVLSDRTIIPEYIQLFKVDADARTIKSLCVQIEELHPLGRIFDLDVYTHLGTLSRIEYGGSDRLCYLCDNRAFECARSREHSLEELIQFLILKAETL